MILVMLLNTSFMMLLYRVCLKKRAGGDSCEKLACFCLKTMKITHEFQLFFIKSHLDPFLVSAPFQSASESSSTPGNVRSWQF